MSRPESPEEMLDLCRACTQQTQPALSRGQTLRLAGYYRLFNQALGFGPEIYQIPQDELDQWRSRIDWDYRRRVVGAGLNGKLTKLQARAALKRRLGKINADRLES